jgi:8-oxo-dGTP pyrophosphatase MutT (NUDIX family)
VVSVALSGDARIPEVRRQLDALVPVDRREACSLARIAHELERLRAPFDEHADPTHVTSSAIVTSARGVLLHRHKRLGLWLQPGGHVDTGEEPAAAAVREVREETGLWARHDRQPPAIAHVDVHSGGRGHIHLDLRYQLHGPEEDPCPPDGESPDVAWFSWPDAIALADPGLRGFLKALIEDRLRAQ